MKYKNCYDGKIAVIVNAHGEWSSLFNKPIVRAFLMSDKKLVGMVRDGISWSVAESYINSCLESLNTLVELCYEDISGEHWNNLCIEYIPRGKRFTIVIVDDCERIITEDDLQFST